MKKTQVFSTDAMIAMLFFTGIITMFFTNWNNELITASENLENNMLELKAFKTIELLLSDKHFGVIDNYHHINEFKLARFAERLNSEPYEALDEFGLADYNATIKLEYLNNSVILSSNEDVQFNKYEITVSKNCFFKNEKARLVLKVGRQ